MRKLIDNGTEEIKDFKQMYKDAFVNVNGYIAPPPLAISIGGHEYRDKFVRSRFGTYGNFSCISGASKSRKSFLKSLMIASYIGGQTSRYAEDIQGHDTEGKYILDFDTEQGQYDSKNTFVRVGRLVGSNSEFHKPFSLRKYDFNERLDFIEYCILDLFKDKLGLVCIDGFADLVSDTNSLPIANEMVQKLLMWTDVSQCHLIGVIHTNEGTTKARGHLGSAIQQKAETVCALSYIDQQTTGVKFTYNRGYPLDDFEMTIDNHGLPYVSESTGVTY